MAKLKINTSNYKIGLNEIGGLETVLHMLAQPIVNYLKSEIYWATPKFTPVEYESRDGFIANSHNCGGLDFNAVIPKCEEYDFGFLNFGECDDSECNHECSCSYEEEGHLDASLRIWLKFEGLNDDGRMMFYFVVAGGNGDAPYFRHKYEETVFETSFTCETLNDLKIVGSRRVNKLIKAIA